MVPEPGIAVAICAYTEARWEWLTEAVRSVTAQSRPAAEVILVVDFNDALLSRAQHAFPGVRVIPNAEAQGLSGARNTATRACQAEIVAFLDDDAAAADDWLESLSRAYSTPNVQGAGGRIDPIWATGRPPWWPPEFDWVVGCTYRGMPEMTTDVRNVIGANMSFRRSAILSAGGFDLGIGRSRGRPMGGEETELSIRISQRLDDARIRYEPLARVNHHVPADRATFRYFVQRCYAEGLSKARVARMTGSDRGLASERRYASRTLPAAAWRNVLGAIHDLEPWRLTRSVTIVVGLAVTIAGYVIGGRQIGEIARSGMPDAPGSDAAGRTGVSAAE